MFPDNTQEYRITDHLASVRATLDGTGAITHTYDYKPFGSLFQGGPEARQSFNSREKDQEAGLFNNGVRKLEDDDGRFTSIDPLWEKFPAWSPYQYGYNNPMSVTDPGGMQGEPVDDDPAVDPYWEGGGGGAGGGGGGSMSASDFITRAWNAIFSTTRSTAGGAGSGPAATPNRLENPDLLPKPSSNPTSRPNTVSDNWVRGKAAEAQVAKEVVNEGSTVVGQQVAARTSQGRRFIDILIRKPNGNLEAIEVKSGRATRTKTQIAKDNAMETEGATLVGKNAPTDLRGQNIKIPTVVRQVPTTPSGGPGAASAATFPPS